MKDIHLIVASELLKIAKEITALQFDTEQQRKEYERNHKLRRTTKVKVKGPGTQYHRAKKIINDLFSQQDSRIETRDNSRFARTPEQFWEKARETQELMESTLNHGHESEWLGSNSRRCELDEQEISKPGACLIIAPIKSRGRAQQRIRRDYGGNYGRLTDAVRCSVAVDTVEDLQKAVQGFRKKQGVSLAAPPRNRLKKRFESGYGDVLCNADFGNGFVGEIQFHLKSMIKAKEFGGGHRLYEEQRSIYGGYDYHTPVSQYSEEDQRRLHENLKKQQRLYNRAFKMAVTARRKDTKYMFSDKEFTYFLYDNDFLAVAVRNEFPMYYSNGKWRKIHSFCEFADNAIRISEKEFLKLMKKRGIKFDK